MVCLLLGISILCLVISIVIFCCVDDELGAILLIFSVLFIFIFGTWACVLWYSVANGGELIPQQIAMYEEENALLEEQVAFSVNAYMQHESATYKEILPENSINIALTFPELTSNEMVQQQITIYMQNREKITNLKNDLINLSAKRWLLYFGR